MLIDTHSMYICADGSDLTLTKGEARKIKDKCIHAINYHVTHAVKHNANETST